MESDALLFCSIRKCTPRIPGEASNASKAVLKAFCCGIAFASRKPPRLPSAYTMPVGIPEITLSFVYRIPTTALVVYTQTTFGRQPLEREARKTSGSSMGSSCCVRGPAVSFSSRMSAADDSVVAHLSFAWGFGSRPGRKRLKAPRLMDRVRRLGCPTFDVAIDELISFKFLRQSCWSEIFSFSPAEGQTDWRPVAAQAPTGKCTRPRAVKINFGFSRK